MKKISRAYLIARVKDKLGIAPGEGDLFHMLLAGKIPAAALPSTIKTFFERNKFSREQIQNFFLKLLKHDVHKHNEGYKNALRTLIEKTYKIPGISVA